MAILSFEEQIIPAQTRKEVTCERTLTAGEQLKAEIGAEDELDEVVPVGKKWDVIVNIRLVETDI